MCRKLYCTFETLFSLTCIRGVLLSERLLRTESVMGLNFMIDFVIFPFIRMFIYGSKTWHLANFTVQVYGL